MIVVKCRCGQYMEAPDWADGIKGICVQCGRKLTIHKPLVPVCWPKIPRRFAICAGMVAVAIGPIVLLLLVFAVLQAQNRGTDAQYRQIMGITETPTRPAKQPQVQPTMPAARPVPAKTQQNTPEPAKPAPDNPQSKPKLRSQVEFDPVKEYGTYIYPKRGLWTNDLLRYAAIELTEHNHFLAPYSFYEEQLLPHFKRDPVGAWREVEKILNSPRPPLE